MISRHCLLPIIPPDSIVEGNCFSTTKHPIRLDRAIRILDKYGHRLGDRLICFPQDMDIVEGLLANTNKKIVPTIWGVNAGHAKTPWIDWVAKNIDRFDKVQVGNATVEIANFGSKTISTTEIGRNLRSHIPEIGDKHLFGPCDADIRRDIETPDNPLKRFFVENSPTITVYCGINNIHVAGFAEWCKGLQVFIGMNWSAGAAQHNLQKFVGYGLAGALFYLPIHEDDANRADAIMEQYLTDVE